MPSVGFEPAARLSYRLRGLALDRSATGVKVMLVY